MVTCLLLRITCRFPSLDNLAIALPLGQVCYAWVPGVLGRCELRSRHMQREIKKQQSSTKDEAFTSESPRSKKQCSNCNKHSHFKADCWAKGGSKEGQGLKRKDKAKDSAAMAEEELGAWADVEEVSADEDHIE